MVSADRYSRQALLPEVGELGQARLSAAEVVVPAGEGREFCALYLARAGCRVVPDVSSERACTFPHQSQFRFAAPRALAGGAWHALRAIRRILELPSAESP